MGSRTYTSQTLDRGLQVLEAIARAERELTISEIAAELSVHRTISYRLLATLEQRALVVRSPVGGYTLGLAVARLAGTVAAPLRAVSRPFLQRLNAITDETVHFAILGRADVVFLEGFESSKALRVSARVGQAHPVHASSMGKAILATYSEEGAREWVAQLQLTKITQRTIVEREEFLAQLRRVRNQGYALNVEESEIGLGSVAAAVVDRRGIAHAALSVAAPIARFTPEIIPRLAKAVIRTASQIGRQL